MKKFKLLLILSFLISTNSFAKEDNVKSNQETDVNLSLEDDKYSKYKEDKYSAPPALNDSKKLEEDDLKIGGKIEVDKETKEVEKLELDLNKKF